MRLAFRWYRGHSIDVLGIDFTSSPNSRKPITVALCSLAQTKLTLQTFEDLRDFYAFERLLTQEGEWIAGIDFPFGQSRKFVKNIGWPMSWIEYISLVNNFSPDEFLERLTRYKDKRPYGDREHRRVCDEQANSISPQKLYGVPVGKMFYEGAKRLLRSPVNIPLLRPADAHRTIIEAYPALVARHFIGRDSYKNDKKKKQTDVQRQARQRLMNCVTSSRLREAYGIRVELSTEDYKICIEDPMADRLDALLCAVQAAWASNREDYGIPLQADALEGWISDPILLQHPFT